MPDRTRHALAAAATLSAVGLLTASPATASSPHEFNGGYREKLDLAGAIWSTQTDTSATSLEIQVFERTEQRLGDRPQDWEPALALFYEHSELDLAAGVLIQTSYEGFTGDSLAFDFDPSLRSGASVSDTVEVAGWRCFFPLEDPGPREEPDCVDLPSATVQVDLEWTQTGEIYRDVERMGGVVPPEFSAHARYVTAASNATVTGHIAGEDLQLVEGPADYGVLIRGGYLEHLLVH